MTGSMAGPACGGGAAGPAIDPVIEALARQGDEFTPDLDVVADWVYADPETDSAIPAELRTVANEIALDWRYDGGDDHPVAIERVAHLSGNAARVVATVATNVWFEAVVTGLKPLAQQLALRLANDPDFDPLPWDEGLSNLVEDRLEGHRPTLIRFTHHALVTHAETSGLMQRNESEVKQAAQDALSRMTPLERDAYGFASRNARRRQLAEKHLETVRPSRHNSLIYWMSRFESEQSGALREARYATASRRLASLGETRASIARLLGISTSVLDRIERENRADVELADDDPILTDLAPSLRR